MWKVENPEDVTLSQILDKWDEVKKEEPKKVKVVFVVEYTGQDEGCTHDVMQTLANHDYKLLEARFENPDGTTLDIMHLAQYVTKEEGKC